MLTERNTEKDKLVADGTKNAEWPWKRAKKVALMVSFRGKDYLGMQRYFLS